MAQQGGVHDRIKYRATHYVLDWLGGFVRGFRRSRPPMPVLVLHADDGGPGADARAAEVVREVYAEEVWHGARCVLHELSGGSQGAPGSPGSPRSRALYALREFGARERGWAARRGGYRPYAFRRSGLIRALEEAAELMPDDWWLGRMDEETARAELLDRLNGRRWRSSGTSMLHSVRDALFDASRLLPALLLTMAAALVSQWNWYAVLGTAVFLVGGLVLVDVLPSRTPVLLGTRSEARWFVNTTFLRFGSGIETVRGGRRIRRVVPPRSTLGDRAYEVARTMRDAGLLQRGADLAAANGQQREGGSARERGVVMLDPERGAGVPAAQVEDAQRFHLQLRVLAMLEDLREGHRSWAPDLRRRKRTAPPMLFLPQVDGANGGIALIEALSDVRSRRSELDPLLVVAAIRQEHVQQLERSIVREDPAAGARRSAEGAEVADGLVPVAQIQHWYASWSRGLRAGQSPSLGDRTLPWVLKEPLPEDWLAREDPVYASVCGMPDVRRTLAGRAWSLPVLVLVLAAGGLSAWGYDAYLQQRYCRSGLAVANRDAEKKSGGLANHAEECVGVATEGGTPFPGARHTQEEINALNAGIGDSPHVTVVYAGPLSGTAAQQQKGADELQGVLAAQREHAGDPVKLKILIANGGAEMQHQRLMARHIVSVAERQSDVIGVAGLGRDLDSSGDVQRELLRADLPVVSSTDSATELPREYGNYFGLTPTDRFQARQLRLIAEQVHKRGPAGRAAVLLRDPAQTIDRYAEEQARYGRAMLEDTGYRDPLRVAYQLKQGVPAMTGAMRGVCASGASVLYFAGRSEDLPALMRELRTNVDCMGRKLSIFAGDDLSRTGSSPDAYVLPRGVTLYHVEPTAPAGGTLPSADRTGSQAPLTHDAVQVLYAAGTWDSDPQSRAATWANIRGVELSGQETGTLNLTRDVPYTERDSYAISLVRQTSPGPHGAKVRKVPLCSREAGSGKVLTEKECAIGK